MRLTVRPRRAARDAAVRGALSLRAPTLALLAGRPLAHEERDALGAGAAAWRLFLAAECCALPLARALRRAGAWNALAPEARAAAAAAEARELQRVLAARVGLAELDGVCAALGISPVVLKGGATVADGTPLDLGDLDLLVTGPAGDALAAVLGARGYEGAPEGDALTRPGCLPVELHDAVAYAGVDHAAVAAGTAGAPPTAPLANCRALRRLVGAPAVLLLLRHGVLHHPFRRGHLRDLVVIADALGRCAPGEVDAVARACDADPAAPALADTLALARALHAGAPTADPRAVRRAAAHKYLVALGTWRRAVRLAPRWPALLCAALDRPAARYAPLWDTLASRTQEDPRWHLPPLARHAPRLAARIGATARLPYRATLVACALAAGPFARRRVERLVR